MPDEPRHFDTFSWPSVDKSDVAFFHSLLGFINMLLKKPYSILFIASHDTVDNLLVLGNGSPTAPVNTLRAHKVLLANSLYQVCEMGIIIDLKELQVKVLISSLVFSHPAF